MRQKRLLAKFEKNVEVFNELVIERFFGGEFIDEKLSAKSV